MHHLFLDPVQIDTELGIVRITGQDHVHLAKVLRARVGQPVIILDGQGNGYLAKLRAIEKRESLAGIIACAELPPEPAIAITVAQAIGKSDKFEQVVQHGTEAGASGYVPLIADRGVVDIPASRLAERMARWRSIAKGAAEQSHRRRVPQIGMPAGLKDVLNAQAALRGTSLMLHTAPSSIPLWTALHRLSAPSRVLLLVGPEGGWSEEETEIAAKLGCAPISLGPRVLRTETAALVAISQLIYHFSRPQEVTVCVS